MIRVQDIKLSIDEKQEVLSAVLFICGCKPILELQGERL